MHTMCNSIARFWLSKLLALVLLIPVPGVLSAQDVPVPPLNAQVVDTTGTLSPEQRTALIQKLQTFEATKGSQIAVLLVPSTQPETIEQYALRVAENWKIGRKNVDDGAILVVALQDRTLRIEVGYGLEGALTDITSKRIIEEIIVPQFRQGDFAGGVAAGVDQMIKVIEGEPLPEPVAQQTANNSSTIEDIAPVLFMLSLFVGGFLRKTIGKLPAALATGGLCVRGGLVVRWRRGFCRACCCSGCAAHPVWQFGGWHGWRPWWLRSRWQRFWKRWRLQWWRRRFWRRWRFG